MSRLDPKIAEENRLAWHRDQASNKRKEVISKWLHDNPEIGSLNGGKFYKIENGEQVFVKAPV